MKNIIAATKNIMRLGTHVGNLVVEQSRERIGVLDGVTGHGKTTAAQMIAVRHNAVYVRAFSVWTPATMLAAIMRELGGEQLSGSAQMIKWIIAKLATEQRALFIDEADYLMLDKRLIETVRDIHDDSRAPVVLVGMESFKRKVKSREQLADRVSEWITFGPADEEDARAIADQLCEVGVADELLQRLMEVTQGNVRRLIAGLGRIEKFAKKKDLDAVDLAAWGDQELVFRSGR